jgi:hypothetical protein
VSLHFRTEELGIKYKATFIKQISGSKLENFHVKLSHHRQQYYSSISNDYYYRKVSYLSAQASTGLQKI